VSKVEETTVTDQLAAERDHKRSAPESVYIRCY
jgi:hypothetical protein